MKKHIYILILAVLVVVGLNCNARATTVNAGVSFLTEYGESGLLQFSYDDTTPVTYYTDWDADPSTPEDGIAIYNGALLSFDLYLNGALIGSGVDSNSQLSFRDFGNVFGFDDLTIDPAFAGPAALLGVQLLDDTATANDGGIVPLPGSLNLTSFNHGAFSLDGNLTFTNFTVVAAVPEPSTLLVLGSGLAGLGFVRRIFKRM